MQFKWHIRNYESVTRKMLGYRIGRTYEASVIRQCRMGSDCDCWLGFLWNFCELCYVRARTVPLNCPVISVTNQLSIRETLLWLIDFVFVYHLCMFVIYWRPGPGKSTVHREKAIQSYLLHQIILVTYQNETRENKSYSKNQIQCKEKISSLYWIWKKALRNSMVKSYILI